MTEKSIYQLQLEYCKKSGNPMFMPRYCWGCKSSCETMYTKEKASAQLITSCAKCYLFFCELRAIMKVIEGSFIHVEDRIVNYKINNKQTLCLS